MRRFASLFLCLTAVVAMMAMTVAPALADEENRGQEKKEEATENHQQADQEASSSKSEESSQKRESAPGREKKSSGSSTSSSGDDGSSQSQGPKPYPTTGDEDPEGKRYDGEGEPRGETAATCTNDDEGNFSGNGANRSGPYDSTCDGSASLAGNGGGSATGRPCAGCVGSADYKNPRGQYPDGNHDGNAGYECDANNGVGRSNPAHTGCRPATTTVPPPP
ncbi:MAG TPA: hypothetical protein VG929_00630, partial [Actinomycetota bacterium]|nr:hypothetical protein [Actinomycetota bacterium]